MAFAEVEKFIDTPAKRYSSGMYARLAFAVAAHLEPEILLVDEVLAVGDADFQKKCLGKMGEVAKEGRTVLFVSHNMAAIQSLCPRAIVLRQGRIVLDAPVDEAIRGYLAHLSSSAKYAFAESPERRGNGWVRLTSARALDETSQPSDNLIAGRPASFEFTYENRAQAKRGYLVFTIYNRLGVGVTNFDMTVSEAVVEQFGASGRFLCHVPNLPLPVGQYRIAAAVIVGDELSDQVSNALVFDVASSTFYRTGRTPPIEYCSCLVQHDWRHEITESMA